MSKIIELDAKGLRCPLPVLKAQKIFKGLAPGDVLVVFATDPGSPSDFQHFCNATGADFKEEKAGEGLYCFVLTKN